MVGHAKTKTKKSNPGNTGHLEVEADFHAESDMRTLIEAEKVKKDKGRMSAALTKGREQRDALASVVDDKKKEA